MSNQIYIPPINFNEFDNQTGSIVSINAVEPLEYNKLNSQLSIKAATENNYGVITTGDQNIKGNKNFVDGLSISTGTISTDPTNDTDITNKKYVESAFTNNIASADLVKYNTSTNYLIDNKTNSNINSLRVSNLSINNHINGSSVPVSVSTNGYHGTDTKTITVYKAYVNGLTCIFFNKNTEINSYKWISEIAMNENGMVMDFSNFSDIYNNLPYMFELTGETSTYGGGKHVATRTLKFIKSSSGYNYVVQYNKSFQMNLFKLKDSIKNTDTYIFTSEANKIGTLTIDKGYLYNTPTENNNLVNKSYVDNIDNEIKNSLNSNISTLNENIENAKSELNENIENAKTELNGNIENAKTELNGNISTAISQINTISLSTGTLENVQNTTNSLTNKNYVDNQISKAKLELNNSINSTKSEINASIDNSVNNAKSELNTSIENAKTELNNNITTAINNIKIDNVNLTTGTISTDPTNDTDITNKKYVDAKADEINNSLNSLKSYGDLNYIKYDYGSSNLIKSSSDAVQIINTLNIDNLTSENSTFTNSTIDTLTCTTSTINNSTTTNLTTETLKINNSLNIDPRIIEFKRFSLQTILDSNSQGITTCVVVFFKIKIGDVYFINIKLNFSPFTSGGTTLYIKNLNITDLGESYGEYNTYFCVVGDTNYIKAARCQFYILRNDNGTYNIEIRNTQDGDKICKFDDFECAYSVVST